ncbi:MAG: hypothetical protein PHQ72_00370 [Hespellia sp.]|nr:hypothetical protein [Hespellia sp.]
MKVRVSCMKKCVGGGKLLAVIGMAFLMAFLIPTVGEAADTPTRTEKLDVSNLTDTTDMLESEGWKWEPDAEGGTLTLRDCNITTDSGTIIKLCPGKITIVLEGANTLKTTSTKFMPMISQEHANYVIQEGAEGGSLNILRENMEQQTYYPYAFAGDTITMESGTIYSNVEFCTISEAFNMTGGTLTVDVADMQEGCAIYSDKGNVTISGGTLDLKSGQLGIRIAGEYPTVEERVSILGGNVTIESGYAGIYAKNILIDTTGELHAQGDKAALVCCADGGEIEIRAAKVLELEGAKLTVPEQSTADKTITIAGADYTEVNQAVDAAAELKKEQYVDFSGVEAAVEAVDYEKNLLEQETVDGYAAAINDAITRLEFKPADYSKVDEAIGKVPKDLSIYTEESVKNLQAAIDAVERGKNISEQELVNQYAASIEKATQELVKKSTTPPNDEGKKNQATKKQAATQTPQTGDTGNTGMWFTFLVISFMAAVVMGFGRKKLHRTK